MKRALRRLFEVTGDGFLAALDVIGWWASGCSWGERPWKQWWWPLRRDPRPQLPAARVVRE